MNLNKLLILMNWIELVNQRVVYIKKKIYKKKLFLSHEWVFLTLWKKMNIITETLIQELKHIWYREIKFCKNIWFNDKNVELNDKVFMMKLLSYPPTILDFNFIVVLIFMNDLIIKYI